MSDREQPVMEMPVTVTRAVTTAQLMELMRAPRAKLPARRQRLTGDQTTAHILRDRCQKLCLSIFFRDIAPARSLGFTSAVAGEGKSFLAMVGAMVLAADSTAPVTLVECNWESPSLHEHFDLPHTPGVAEWLRGEASEAQTRHQVAPNLSVIPAGSGHRDAVQLLRLLRERDALARLAGHDGLLLVDLPPILTTSYGALAASLVDSVLVVVRAGVTPNPLIQEAVSQIGGTRIEGAVLNQMQSRIPGWIRQLL